MLHQSNKHVNWIETYQCSYHNLEIILLKKWNFFTHLNNIIDFFNAFIYSCIQLSPTSKTWSQNKYILLFFYVSYFWVYYTFWDF